MVPVAEFRLGGMERRELREEARRLDIRVHREWSNRELRRRIAKHIRRQAA